MTNYVKVKQDMTQQNSKHLLGVDGGEMFNDMINEYNQLA